MQSTTKKKVIGAAALIAGVGLGSVAGALFGAPSVSGAATAVSEVSEVGAHPGPGFGGRGARLEAAAEALGMTTEELRTALSEGSTLAEIAEAEGVALDTLIGALVAEANALLDEAVADGRITEEEAAERREGIEERVTAFVNGEGRGPFGGGRFGCDDDTDDAEDTESETDSESTTTTEGS